MDETARNIVIGVVSGVITAGLLFVAARFWNDTLLPVLKQWKYHGVEIDGQWRGFAQDAESTTEISLTLTQRTLDLTGLMTVRHRSPTNSFDLTFLAVGKIWEGYVTLGFTPAQRTITAVATALLKIDGGGVSLVGQMLFRNVNTDRVHGMLMSLNRMDGRQMPGVAPAPPRVPASPDNDKPPTGEEPMSPIAVAAGDVGKPSASTPDAQQ